MFFKNSASYDYHLTQTEQEQTERLVPSHQAKIHLAFRADINYENKNYDNSSVALSEHLVTICNRGFFGRGFRLLMTFHVYDITYLNMADDDSVEIQTTTSQVTIISPTAIRFTRNLIRNFILSNSMMPPALRFSFNVHDPEQFPEFNPQLSPSQQFQFTYNANCSYFNETYYHDIPRYFHNLIQTGSGIFDFTQLPMHLMECGLGNSTDIRPITASLMFDPYVYGINCEDITRNDIILACASVVLMNPNLKILRLIETGAENGGIQLANAMAQDQHPSVIYWDLSENKLKDFGYFLDSIAFYRAPLMTLRLKNCSLSTTDITTLLTSLIDNEDTHSIHQLTLSGNRFNKVNCSQFGDYLKTISECETKSLSHLELGPLDKPQIIIDAFLGNLLPISILKIVDSKFDDISAESFVNYLQSTTTLTELDLSGCKFTDRQLGLIINAILSNPNISEIRLSLCRLKIHGKRYTDLMPTLIENADKIVSLSLDENGLTLADPIVRDVQNFRKLKQLSLAMNYTHRMNGIGKELSRLLEMANLKSLDLSGNRESCAMQQECTEFISSLFNNSTLENINISGNQIGDSGLKTLTNVLRNNATLKVVNADDSEPTNISKIYEFFDVVSESRSLIEVHFPVNDIYYLLSNAERESQLREFELLSQKRMISQVVMMTNRAKCGMYSNLSLLSDRTLDDLVDSITLDMQQKIEEAHVNEHLAITEIVGLPLPYEAEQSLAMPIYQNSTRNNNNNNNRDDEKDVEDIENAENNEEPYISQELMSKVIEPDNDESELESYKTLQFNSLCIRRPDATQRLEQKARYLLMDFPQYAAAPTKFTPNSGNKLSETSETSEASELSETTDNLGQFADNACKPADPIEDDDDGTNEEIFEDVQGEIGIPEIPNQK